MICQGLMSKKTKEHHKRVQFSQWHHRFFVLYDDRLEYYKNKGGDLRGAYPLSQIDGVQIPSEGTGFRFELLVKTSRHDKGRTVSLLTQSNTKLHEWVRAIKETLYIFHLKTGGEEGERKAKAMGVAPESLWEEWNYSFEKPSTPEEKAREIAAEERAAAELRRLGASSPSQESQASSSSSSDSDTTHKRSTSDPIPTVSTLTLDPTIPYGTTSGVNSTPAPTASPPSSISPSSPPTKGTSVYFPETTSSSTSPTRASQQLKIVRIGEEVPSLDSPHSMLPSLRASLMQRKIWSGSSPPISSNQTGTVNSSSSTSESRSTSTTS